MASALANDGVSINYDVVGKGSSSVILLHGWGGSAAYWRPLISHLDLTGLQVISLTYRGHGDSDKPAAGYRLDQFAKDVVAVADAAGAKRFVLVGYSMSGKFAQYVAAAYPERTVGLVLVAPVPASDFPIPADVGKAWCDSQSSREVAFQTIVAPFVKIPIPKECTEAFLDDFQKATRVALEQTLVMCSVSFVDKTRQLHVPTLVLAGIHDPLLTLDLLRDTILSQIVGARMIKLPCNHEIPQEMPDHAAALLEAFLCGISLAPAGVTVARARA
jgi:pimeloyl-ACP methyl ester carboxylesterase